MKALAAVLLIALAGCGAKGPLKWPEGTPPPAPVGEKAPLTSEKMLEPPPQAAPERVDDPLKRSEERREDRFELPPPGR
jgi:predicted small lipoprotein YifL